MRFLTISFTPRARRIPKPQELPQVDSVAAREWFAGWWHGIAIGVVIGAGLVAAVGGLS